MLVIFENSCVQRKELDSLPAVTIVYGDLERKLHPSRIARIRSSVKKLGKCRLSVEDEAINYEIELRRTTFADECSQFVSRLREVQPLNG